MEELQLLSDTASMDERGFQWIAGVHGGFGGQPYCHHGDLHFLTWHRPYVLDMELKLRARIATVADQATADEWRLPYWEWDALGVLGLPDAFTVATYLDNGTVKPNPLLSAPYQLPYPITDIDAGDPTDHSWRAPGSLAELRSYRTVVENALREPNFIYFSNGIQQAHNSLHNWTGGFMPTLRSSFDPIFWVHHANVDRQFWQWQQSIGQPDTIPRLVRDYPCQPFDFTDIRAEAFFDTRKLGYTYAMTRSLVTAADAASLIADTAQPAPLPLDFGPLPAQFQKVRINLHGVRHPERTCELRIFADRDTPPVAETPLTTTENFLGSYVLLGHGSCPGAPGHCDPIPEPSAQPGIRPPRHLAPFDVYIDVTEPLRAVVDALPAGGRRDLRAQLIALDTHKKQLPAAAVAFGNVSLTTG
jgi:tyrosinase